MTGRAVRHWRSYGDHKLPTGAEALNEPFSVFPSWFLRITCDRCGKVQFIAEVYAGRWRDRPLLYDGCGTANEPFPHAPALAGGAGRAAKATCGVPR